jgi:hypothetical protein
MTPAPRRYVIHLPVIAPDLTRARFLARTAVRSLAFLTQLDPGETTVSEEEAQEVRHAVALRRSGRDYR